MNLPSKSRIPISPGDNRSIKSPWMVGSFFLLWVGSLFFFGPRLWAIVIHSGTILEGVLLFLFSLLLALFWMLGAYYTSVVVFSFLSKPLPAVKDCPVASCPEIAILYLSCNDFQAPAAQSCLNQVYPRFHVFLLDDSTSEDARARVDAFHAQHPERTTVVRRPSRKGYKSGNLNHALHGPAAAYPFFAVVDADERLPQDFLVRMMSRLQDPDLAFVQANHAPNPGQVSTFARDIAPTILPFWHVHCRTRNRFGLVLYLGHGALVRRSAWERVGGFPEIITEDLAFSALLADQGLRGVFEENITCLEDFPSTYGAFKRQFERYVVGTFEVLRKYIVRVLRSRKITWTEKSDFILWSLPLYVPAICLAFAMVTSLGLTLVLGNWETLSISLLGQTIFLPVIRVFNERFAPLWLVDFQVFSVLCAFSPAFACMVLGAQKKLSVLRLLVFSTVPFMALMVVSWRGILGYLLTGRTVWPPTGEPPPNVKEKKAIRLQAGWRSPRKTEIFLGVVLSVMSLLTFNLAMFSVCLCLLIGVLMELSGWDTQWVKGASGICFTLILLQILINLSFYIQPYTFGPFFFTVHF